MSDTLVHGVEFSRRSFLVSAGGATIGVAFGASDSAAQTMGSMFKPNAWATIGTNGTITLVSAASEMGQGTMTAMPLLVAEEMDADWKKVRVVQAPADAKSYGN